MRIVVCIVWITVANVNDVRCNWIHAEAEKPVIEFAETDWMIGWSVLNSSAVPTEWKKH